MMAMLSLLMNLTIAELLFRTLVSREATLSLSPTRRKEASIIVLLNLLILVALIANVAFRDDTEGSGRVSKFSLKVLA